MGRTCGEPNEIKKYIHPKNVIALLAGQLVEIPHRENVLAPPTTGHRNMVTAATTTLVGPSGGR